MGTLTASLHVKHQVARCARVSDEAVFANNLRDTPHLLREAISGVLLHSPIGFQVNANTAQNPPACSSHGIAAPRCRSRPRRPALP